MTMHTIKKLSVTSLRVPLGTPHRTASGVVSESPLVAIDIETSQGIVGHALVFTYTVAALKPTAELIANLESLFVGEELAPARLSDNLARRFRLLGTQGLVGMALAGIDMALWDAFARSQEQSLSAALGFGPARIQAYGAVGYDGVREAALVAADWVKRGFKGVKIKIGYPDVREDLEVIRAVRAEIGPDSAMMLDYNQSLTPTDAIERMKRIDEEQITWVEEPTLAHDFVGHAKIARAARTPIQRGENWWGPQDMQKAIEADASNFMMLDVMKIGGVTGWMRAAALGQVNGIRLSSHLWPEVSAHLLSATPTAHWLEYADWWNAILQDPLELDDGFAVTSSAVGSGLQWAGDAFERYRV